MTTMSSFLMNSGTYVDPKFPPSEEYNQSSYIPATDYYHQAQHYGYAVNGLGGVNGGVALNSHQSASMGYYGQHPSHGAGYYGAPCGMTPAQAGPMTGHVAPTTLGHQHHLPPQQQQQPQHSSPGLIQRSPLPSPTPSLTSMAACPTQGQTLSHHVSPLLHPHLQPIHHAGHHQLMQQQHGQLTATQQQHAQLAATQQQQLHASIPQQTSAQTQIQQQQQQQNGALQLCQPPTPNSPESDCDDATDSDESHNPVIYPWMKKIHVAGTRKLFFETLIHFKIGYIASECEIGN